MYYLLLLICNCGEMSGLKNISDSLIQSQHLLIDDAAAICTFAISSNSSLAAIAYDDKNKIPFIRIIDIKTQKTDQTIQAKGKSIVKLFFTNKSDCLIGVSLDGTIRRWSLPGGRLLAESLGDDSYIYSACLGNTEKELITSGKKNKISIFNASSCSRITKIEVADNINITSLVHDAINSRYIGTGSDGSIFLWNGDSRKVEIKKKTHNGKLNTSCISPDGKYYTTCSESGEIILWDTKTWLDMRTWTISDAIPLTCQFDSDSAHIAIGCSSGEVALLFTQENSLFTQIRYIAHEMPVTALGFIGSGETLYTATYSDVSLLIWNNMHVFDKGMLKRK